MFAAHSHDSARFVAIVLAGQRPEGDAVAAAAGVPLKAFAKVAGKPMIHYVLEALEASGLIARIVISSNHAAAFEADPFIQSLKTRIEVIAAPALDQPAQSFLAAHKAYAGNCPVLLATADNPMLSAETVREFCGQALEGGKDMFVALADAGAVSRAVPEGGRTNYRFRGIAAGACNLFALMTPRAVEAVHFWTSVQSKRKKAWRIAAAFGPAALLRMAFRRMTLEEAFQRAGKTVGISIEPVIVRDPLAGYDVDTPRHLAAVERIMTARRGKTN